MGLLDMVKRYADKQSGSVPELPQGQKLRSLFDSLGEQDSGGLPSSPEIPIDIYDEKGYRTKMIPQSPVHIYDEKGYRTEMMPRGPEFTTGLSSDAMRFHILKQGLGIENGMPNSLIPDDYYRQKLSPEDAQFFFDFRDKMLKDEEDMIKFRRQNPMMMGGYK